MGLDHQTFSADALLVSSSSLPRPWHPAPQLLTRPPVPMLQESLLESDVSGMSLGLSLCSSPALSEGPADDFPCFGDELEEQAKLLEETWCARPPPPPARSAPPAAG